MLLLDWKRGTYEGVRLGDHSAKLQRVLGRPEQRGRNESFEPIGEDFYDIGGLTNFGSPDIGAVGDFETLRYRRRVFSTDGGTVTAWGTTDPRARTPEGVGIGDEREVVERRYAGADCFTQNEGTEYVKYPFLQGTRLRWPTTWVRGRPDQEPVAGGRDQDRAQALLTVRTSARPTRWIVVGRAGNAIRPQRRM